MTLSKLARTGAQRRADALAIMAERSSGADGTTPAAPLFTVHCDLETLRRLATGRATDPDGAAPEPLVPDSTATEAPTSMEAPERPEPPERPETTAWTTAPIAPDPGGPGWPAGRRCELDDGTVLTPHHLPPWLTDAEVERVVFGPGPQIIELGRRSRLFRHGARRVVEIRDRHCTFPGCTVPLARCDADHVVEWGDGGETNPANGRLLCGPHNRQRPGRTTPPTAGP